MKISSFVIALLPCITTFGQDKTSEIDKVFSWTSPTAPGCACTVYQNGQLIADRAYGSADLERAVPITTSSVFDAGSLRKQFIAAAMLLLVEEKRLALTDDIRKYIKELPDYGYKITIDNLLTHTSGIRDWIGMQQLAKDNPDALTLAFRQRGLNFVSGEEWAYSNSGYALAKEIVARVSGMPFAEFTRKRLFEPLGMQSTSFREDLRAPIKDRALAYNKTDGQWKVAMLLDNDRGGGGALFTTAADLVLWNEGLTGNKLGRFVSEKLQEPAKLNNGRVLSYGRGLMLDIFRGTPEIWHSGSADGYKSWLGRYPAYGISIGIMCNSGDGTDRRSFARRIFNVLVPDTAGSQPEFNPLPPLANIEGLDVNSKAGLYFNEKTGEALRLVTFQGRLRVDNGPGFLAVTNNRFKRWGAVISFMSQDDFELNFLSSDQFELKSMEGVITRYRRAQQYTPTSTDLQAFAGRYESNEIGSVFLIAATADGIEASLGHAPDRKIPFKAVAPDTFQASQIFIHFVRDKQGKVIAFEFTNPAVRKIKFSRLAQ
ncbi:MAG: beta-lactamase family protein [Niastella sp.]|nr:beta-lactamase family protein [Niastella sp.]